MPAPAGEGAAGGGKGQWGRRGHLGEGRGNGGGGGSWGREEVTGEEGAAGRGDAEGATAVPSPLPGTGTTLSPPGPGPAVPSLETGSLAQSVPAARWEGDEMLTRKAQ